MGKKWRVTERDKGKQKKYVSAIPMGGRKKEKKNFLDYYL